VRSFPILYTKSPTPGTILVAAGHTAHATYTPRDKQTRFSKWNKDKGKTNKIVQNSNSNLVKSMTHHNQTKELTTWFLNLPLDESIDNKRHEVWSSNLIPHEAQLEDQKPTESSRRSSRKSKTTKVNKIHEKQQNNEKSKKTSKPKQKLKINTPPEINSP
jgi:hypothetical protein